MNCLNCNAELKKRQNRYCSNACQSEHKHKQYIQRWKDGKEKGLKGKFGISNHIRKYLLDKYENKCCICGWGEKNQFLQTIPLEVHHINGDYKNNSENNLQILCPNCHSLTANYKNSSKKGREGRKKYYANPELGNSRV